MLQWEHFNEPSVVTVFLALLLNADRDGKTDINLGGLMSLTGLSHNTINRAIAKLVKSGEISRIKHGSRITTTITNWSEYQGKVLTQNLGNNQKQLDQNLGEYTPKNGVDIIPKNESIQYNKNNKKDKEVVADAHARTHEEFIADALNDLRVEQGCIAMGVTPDEYRQLVTEVTNDWIFRNIPDNEWTLTHLLAQMRIKHNINNRNNGERQTNGSAGNSSRERLAREYAAEMAALTTEGKRTEKVPF